MKIDSFSSAEFEARYTYHGNDLGAVWTREATAFRLWAPTATGVKLNLYKGGTEDANDLIEQVEMTPDINGTWIAKAEGDLNGVYYTYLVEVNGSTVEACDPYARTTGVNGKRAMVIDLGATNPEGWVLQEVPENATAVGIPAQIVRVQGEKVKKYVDEVDQTSVENPTLAKLETLAKRLEELEQKLDEKNKNEEF